MIRLLIVDDETASIKTMKQLLNFTEFGIELVGEAHNGFEAMEAIRTKNPDIVISDMNMPVMDGVSLIRYIQDSQLDIKLIVCSGYNDFNYTYAALKGGAHEYLLKPIDRRQLNTAVAECCDMIREAKRIEVRSSNKKFRFDVESYAMILQHADKLVELLKYRNMRECEILLHSLEKNVIMLGDGPEMASATFRIIASTLERHVISHHMSFLEWDESQVADFQNCNEAFAYILECIECFIMEQERNQQEKCAKPLEKVKQYLDEHYNEKIYLNDVAMKFNYNKQYLTTLFRKKYGITIGDYIIRLKIEDAKRQLKYTNKTMDEILEDLGYTDSSYFYRQFKKVENVSPGHYRRMHTAVLDTNGEE